jgi:hypothetical protein
MITCRSIARTFQLTCLGVLLTGPNSGLQALAATGAGSPLPPEQLRQKNGPFVHYVWGGPNKTITVNRSQRVRVPPLGKTSAALQGSSQPASPAPTQSNPGVRVVVEKRGERVYRGLNKRENPNLNERRYAHESQRSPHL